MKGGDEMNKVKIGIGIAILSALVIGGVVLLNPSKKIEENNTELSLNEPELELTKTLEFISPTDDFDYKSYVEVACDKDNPDVSLIDTEYLTWEEYDLSKPDYAVDIKYELKFPNGKSVHQYLHVQTQVPLEENPYVDHSDTANNTPLDGDVGEVPEGYDDSGYNNYKGESFILQNGRYDGEGTGEWLLNDQTFLFTEYNNDKRQTFNAAKEYADSGAGRYIIVEYGPGMSFTGYLVQFLDIDKFEPQYGEVIEIYKENID